MLEAYSSSITLTLLQEINGVQSHLRLEKKRTNESKSFRFGKSSDQIYTIHYEKSEKQVLTVIYMGWACDL